MPRGSVYGLLGRNAAGKTTTLQILMGILRPRRGRIALLGQNVPRVTPKLRRIVGYVPQEPRFYPWMTVARLGAFVGAHYPTWDAGLYFELLDGFGLDRTDRVRVLSTGSRMKLAFALALSHRPELLILDEPTAGVDPITRREILDRLRKEIRGTGRAALISSHELRELEPVIDTVGVLHGGALVHEGPVEALDRAFRRSEVGAPVPEGWKVLFSSESDVILRREQGEAPLFDSHPVSLEDIFIGLTRSDR